MLLFFIRHGDPNYFPDQLTPLGHRQAEAVARAVQSMQRVMDELEAGLTPDIILTEVEGAMTALGELTGASIREDVTNRIFARFCVGK